MMARFECRRVVRHPLGFQERMLWGRLLPLHGERRVGESKDGNMRGIRSARPQQCLRTASVRLVDEEVRGLVRRAIHVVDAVLL